MPVQRLFPHAIAGEEQTFAPFVPKSNRKHSIEPMQCFVAPLLVGVHDHFRIALRSETVPSALQLIAQLLKIVDLAVEHDNDGAILIAYGLLPASDVYNR